MEAAEFMSIQEIGSGSKERIGEYPNQRGQKHTKGFHESLLQNLKCQEREGASPESDKNGREIVGSEVIYTSVREMPPEPQTDRNVDQTGVGVSGNAARIRMSGLMNHAAVQAVEVRHMSYEDSDNIEIAVVDGYTLKGKREGGQVYVEAKYDDGRLEAYRVDPDRVQEQTQQRIERFALETVAEKEGVFR